MLFYQQCALLHPKPHLISRFDVSQRGRDGVGGQNFDHSLQQHVQHNHAVFVRLSSIYKPSSNSDSLRPLAGMIFTAGWSFAQLILSKNIKKHLKGHAIIELAGDQCCSNVKCMQSKRIKKRIYIPNGNQILFGVNKYSYLNKFRGCTYHKRS